MRSVCRRAVLSLICCAAACAGQPAEADGRAVVARGIDGGDASRLMLTHFTKTDGKAMEIAGVKLYEVQFAALATFRSDAMYELHGAGNKEGAHIVTSPLGADSGVPGELGPAASGQRRAYRGDILILEGTVIFSKRESGWVGDAAMTATLMATP